MSIRILLTIGVFIQVGFVASAAPFDDYIDLLARDIKELNVPVLDRAQMLQPQKHSALQRLLTDFHAHSQIAVVVVTVPSMRGGQIDDFTNRLYEKIGIGERGVDKGALLLVSKLERKLRIETGYGVEDLLTDSEAAQIINQQITPSFRRGDFSAGIEIGAVSIIRELSPGFLESYSNGQFRNLRYNSRDNIRDHWFSILFVIIMNLFVAITLFNRHYGRGRGGWSSTSGGYYGWHGGGSRGGGFSGGGGGFGGFGGGFSGGGGASGGW